MKRLNRELLTSPRLESQANEYCNWAAVTPKFIKKLLIAMVGIF